MANEDKILKTTQLYNSRLKHITSSVEYWQEFIKTSAKFYKYSFPEQVLIAAQRPEAEAVAKFDVWSKKLNRKINKNATGIPVLHFDENGKTGLHYLYDYADTSAHNDKSVEPKIWNISQEDIQTAVKNIDLKYNMRLQSDELIAMIYSLSARLFDPLLSKYMADISKAKKNSLMENMSDDTIRKNFVGIAISSIIYSVCARCNIEPIVSDKDFAGIGYFNTKELTAILGNAVSTVSGGILRELEIQAKAIERSKINERGNEQNDSNRRRSDGYDNRELNGNIGVGFENGGVYGTDLAGSENRQDKDRLYGYDKDGGERVYTQVERGERSDLRSGGDTLHISPSVGTSGTDGVRVGNVGQGESQLFEERRQRNLDNNADGLYTPETSDRNRESSGSDGRKTDETNDENRGNNRGIETERLDGVGTPVQQSETQSVGDSTRRTDIHINDTETAEEAKSPAVSSLQIIGNTPFRYIPQKTYRKLADEVSEELIAALENTDIKYSGKRNNDGTVTFTFSRNDIEQADKLISEAKENNRKGFSTEEIDIAKNTDIAAFLSSRGEQLKKVGREYTMPQHDSMRINGNKFFWNSRSIGGNAVTFCMEYYGMDFKTAVQQLNDFNGYSDKSIPISTTTKSSEKPVEKEPEKREPVPNGLDSDTRRTYAYLTKTRHLSHDTVNALIKSGQLGQDTKGNAVFKIFDENNEFSGAEIVGTTEKKFKQITERSQNGFVFNPESNEKPETALLFESAIDMLSYYELHKDTKALLISMSGLKDIIALNMLERYGISRDNAFVAVDNDVAGDRFAQKMQNEYGIKRLSITDDEIFKRYNRPVIKDWNELLETDTLKIVENFRQETEKHFKPIQDLSAAEIEQIVKDTVSGIIEENGIDVEVTDVVVSGSRSRGIENAGSDLDIVLEYKGDYSEDGLFNILNDEETRLVFGNVTVDINPISYDLGNSLENYLPTVEEYLKEKAEKYSEIHSEDKPTEEYVIPDIVLEHMPDTSISLEERSNYGYTWNGMLPLSAKRAEELFEQVSIYELSEDNTEHQIESIEELRQKADSIMFGVEADEWVKIIEPQLNKLKETAAETGLPYSTRFYGEESSEDFVYDGSITLEDYQKSTQAAENKEPERKFDIFVFEKTIPYNMRFKEYDFESDGLYWVTQGFFSFDDLKEFQKALINNDIDKAYVTTRDLSSYDFEKDMAKNVFAVVTKNEINAENYEQSIRKSNNVNVTFNDEKNGIEIRFKDKPEKDVLEQLKSTGFRWSSKQKMWYAKQNDETLNTANIIMNRNSKENTILNENVSSETSSQIETNSFTDDKVLQAIKDKKEIKLEKATKSPEQITIVSNAREKEFFNERISYTDGDIVHLGDMGKERGLILFNYKDTAAENILTELKNSGYKVVGIEDFPSQEQHTEDIVKGKFQIYQLPDTDDYHGIRFEGTDTLKRAGVQLNHEDYKLVYEGSLEEFNGNATLEDIYTRFNMTRPDDFTGRSLSVSDVIVISVDNKDKAYFCDRVGFTEMPDFFLEKELIGKPKKENSTSSQVGTKSETIDFHQQGAFYEAYGDNALKVAKILGLHTTTKYGEPMVGIPQHTAEEYFQKLKENGYSVNLSEETKLAAETKKSHLMFGLLGNGITVYDTSKTNILTNDYLNVAHISNEGTVKYLSNIVSDTDKKLIQAHADNQRSEFMKEWNRYSVEEKYAKLLSRCNTSQFLEITKTKAELSLSMEQVVDRFFDEIILQERSKPKQEHTEQQEERENAPSIEIKDETVTERAENKLEEKSTSSQVGTKSETDFNAIVKNAEEHYNRLYENTDNDKFYSEAVALGEKFIRENPDFMTGLYNVRKDTYSSDREVASLAFALADVGMIEKFTDEISKTENKQENSQRIDLMSDSSPTDDIISKAGEAKEMTLLISKESENFDDVINKLLSVAPVTSELDKSIIAPVYSDNVDFITQVLEEYGAKYEVIDKPYEEFKTEALSQVGTKSEMAEQALISEPPKNFIITDNELGNGGQKEKYHRNIEAIKTLYTVERENRQATPQEQEILSKYVGWGGIAEVFDERKTNRANEYQELKELLPAPEYNAARASVNNAHFTSPVIIKAMYDVLKNIGFKDGSILEPSLGIGNFFGMLPEEMKGSKLYGVELDSITGRIAKQLYPNSDIQVKGFENTNFTSNTFDVAIGNVPFGNYRVYDSNFKSNDLIHDFFFKKSLDKVRPGGVVAFITSKGTLDKQNTAVREYLAQRADLLGAIRLPNNAFKANAGTEVTSDIIFLQKRESIRDFSKEEMPDWVSTAADKNGIEINSYFVNNPDMVLGEITEVSGQYGQEITCKPFEDKELPELLEKAVTNIKGSISENTYSEQRKTEAVNNNIYPEWYRNFCYTVIDGDIYYRENNNMIKQNITGKKADIMKGLINISEILRELIAYQRDNYTDEYIQKQQDKLNKAYDDFTSKYGLIDEHKKLFKSDDNSPLLFSLENLDENGKLISKADIFTKRTIKAYEPVTSVDTASEALAVSISEKACVDLNYMSELCSKTTDDIIKELEGVIFENPVTNQYETSDEYLSGNVRKKLETAKEYAALDSKYEVNVKALEAVQPEPLTAAQISVQLGASWVPVKYYEQFMYETFNTPIRCKSDCIWRDKARNPFSSTLRADNETIMIDYNANNAEYGISNKTSFAADRENLTVTSTYGTKRLNAYQILESTLNQKPVKVVDYIDDGYSKKAVPNEKETLLAQEKQNMIKQRFQEWIFDDFDRTEELCRIYNEKFNSVRLREYDGSHLNFVGMNPEITLRKHQVDAIAHTIYGGNTLLAHTVGAGKSFEMIASAMESKRLGLCSKSLICVPKHIVNQFAKEFLQLYPGANILVPDEKDFSKANRQKFCSRIATGNYDAIIISHNQFEKIPLSEERQREFIQAEIEKLTNTIGETTKDSDRGFTVKQLEATKKNLEARLKKLNNNEKRDTVVTFEELGVDNLYVDEAHAFKNLYFTSKMGRNVSGINTSSMSQRATDMLMKVRYLDEITDSRGTTFATGTPLSNSMTELYTMQSYLQRNKLEEQGLLQFDAWASCFGETQQKPELSPEGKGFQMKTRFKFNNIPELMTMFRESADIKTADMLKLPVPEAEFHIVSTKASEFQEEMVDALAERADNVRNRRVKPEEDNMLNITNDGRKLALDQRIVNPLLPDDENSKVNKCIENVFDIWEKTTDKKSAQMIFCDLSTPHYDGNFNVYDDIKKKLTEKGIPEKEIAFIHDCSTDAQKQALFTRVRNGEVRVLLGSTNKMGTGTNCQQKLIALHHLDCPYRPADLEQRNGRIIRQGNENEKVDIYNYVTEGTFDSYLYQLVENKQRFISQIMTNNFVGRSAEDVDETVLSYAQIKSIATGNPKIREQMDLSLEVNQLRTVFAAYQEEKRSLQQKINRTFPEKISSLNERISGLSEDIKQANKTKSAEFSHMTVDGITYSDKKEAEAAFLESCRSISAHDKNKEIGEYRGFKLYGSFNASKKGIEVTLKGKCSYTLDMGSDIYGNIRGIQRLDGSINNISGLYKKTVASLETTKSELEKAKIEVTKPFVRLDELRTKEKKLNELTLKLSSEKKAPKEDTDVSDEDKQNKRKPPDKSI